MADVQERLVSALSAADDALSRLDERVRACPYRAGWAARQDFLEAVAYGWNSGFVAPLEDLILHDEGMDVRMPDEALRAAHGVVRARRKAQQGDGALLSSAGAAWLAGRRRRAPSPPLPAARTKLDEQLPILADLVQRLEALRAGVTEGSDAAVAEWLTVLAVNDPRLPATLQAAAALEGWRIVEPYARETYVGPLLVAVWLRERRRLRHVLLGVEAGYRGIMRKTRPSPALPPAERILFWLAVLAESASEAAEGLNRLELARQVCVTRIGPRRSHSHLGKLVDLMLTRPAVSAPFVADRLKVSPQSARRLLGELGGTVTEISGKARFRAWRLG